MGGGLNTDRMYMSVLLATYYTVVTVAVMNGHIAPTAEQRWTEKGKTMDKHTATEQAYKRGYEDGKQDAMKWIPVTERLPDTQDYDWVLAQITLKPDCIYCVPVTAELRADGWYDAYDMMIDGKYQKVTHWMPLPQPPKEG